MATNSRLEHFYSSVETLDYLITRFEHTPKERYPGIVIYDGTDILLMHEEYEYTRSHYNARIALLEHNGLIGEAYADVYIIANGGNSSLYIDKWKVLSAKRSRYEQSQSATTAGAISEMYVPYVGATTDVQLGQQSLTAKSLKTDSVEAKGSGILVMHGDVFVESPLQDGNGTLSTPVLKVSDIKPAVVSPIVMYGSVHVVDDVTRSASRVIAKDVESDTVTVGNIAPITSAAITITGDVDIIPDAVRATAILTAGEVITDNAQAATVKTGNITPISASAITIVGDVDVVPAPTKSTATLTASSIYATDGSFANVRPHETDLTVHGNIMAVPTTVTPSTKIDANEIVTDFITAKSGGDITIDGTIVLTDIQTDVLRTDTLQVTDLEANSDNGTEIMIKSNLNAPTGVITIKSDVHIIDDDQQNGFLSVDSLASQNVSTSVATASMMETASLKVDNIFQNTQSPIMVNDPMTFAAPIVSNDNISCLDTVSAVIVKVGSIQSLNPGDINVNSTVKVTGSVHGTDSHMTYDVRGKTLRVDFMATNVNQYIHCYSTIEQAADTGRYFLSDNFYARQEMTTPVLNADVINTPLTFIDVRKKLIVVEGVQTDTFTGSTGNITTINCTTINTPALSSGSTDPVVVDVAMNVTGPITTGTIDGSVANVTTVNCVNINAPTIASGSGDPVYIIDPLDVSEVWMDKIVPQGSELLITKNTRITGPVTVNTLSAGEIWSSSNITAMTLLINTIRANGSTVIDVENDVDATGFTVKASDFVDVTGSLVARIATLQTDFTGLQDEHIILEQQLDAAVANISSMQTTIDEQASQIATLQTQMADVIARLDAAGL